MAARRRAGALPAAVLAVVMTAAAGCGSTVSAAGALSQPARSESVGQPDGLGPGDSSNATPSTVLPGSPAAALTGGGSGDGRLASGPVTGMSSGSTAPDGRVATPTGSVGRAPITIGVLAAGSFSDAAASAGGNSGTSTSGDGTMKAVLRYYEQRGGIAGRRIHAIFSTVAPTTTDYDSALAAECAHFTQDNNVAVLLSNIGYYKDSFEACLNAKRKPHIEGGWGLTDEADLRRFPGYYLPNMPSYDDRFASLVASGIQSGQLTRDSKVGVIVEDCPTIQRAYAREWQPRARSAGLVVDEFHTKCISGAEDAGQLAQDMQSAQLRFRADGVTTVMFATYPTEVNVLFFTQSASGQKWYPKYYLDSKARVGHESTTGNYPADQLRNMRGVGWAPALDVTKPTLTAPAQKRCLAIMKQYGINVQTGLDAELAFSACDPFFLLEAALAASRGGSEPAALQRAIEAMGSTFSASGNGAATTFSTGRHYGTALYATWAFRAQCNCAAYSGGFRSWR